jgi:hypothetical protein
VHLDHDPDGERADDKLTSGRQPDGIADTARRWEPLLTMVVQVGMLIATVTSNWPGHPKG